jgi:hypothetical protein
VNDYGTRAEFAQITGRCDTGMDEHAGWSYGRQRFNRDDQITEVRYACQCGDREDWVPLEAARRHGYTG